MASVLRGCAIPTFVGTAAHPLTEVRGFRLAADVVKDALGGKPERGGPKRRARETIELFASGDQTPVKTFGANTPSIFDLTKLNPGTIFRVTEHIRDLMDMHAWFIVEEGDNRQILVYEVAVLDREKEADIHASPTLRLKGVNWKLQQRHPLKTHFNATEAYDVLLGQELKTKTHVEAIQVDVMHAGTAKKAPKRSPHRAKRTLDQLQPAPDTVRI